MTRPGFVLKVDKRTPPLLILVGGNVSLQRFPTETGVVYPPQPVPSSDPVTLVEGALASPVNNTLLVGLLRPGMKLTVVAKNVDPVRPGMRFDIRRSIVKCVLEHTTKAWVDDVAIVVADGPGPWRGGQDIVEALGDRITTSFLPEGRVASRDVTSEDLITVAAVTGEPVKVEARIAESDLVILVDACHGPGGRMLLAAGATDMATIDRVGGLGGSRSEYRRVATAIHRTISAFSIIVVFGRFCPRRRLGFLNHCEQEWRLPGQVAYATTRRFTALLPQRGTQKLYAAPSVDYELCSVIGGDPAQMTTHAAEVWQTANAVATPRTGILLTSVWDSGLDSGDSVGSSVNASHQALRNAGTSFLRDGGMLTAFHPPDQILPNQTLTPAADFFTKVLPVTRGPTEIYERFERQTLVDDWYLRLYRDHGARHPLAVSHTWYGVRRDTTRLADVIWVGADREAARTLGQRAAITLDGALDLARQITGDRGDITYLHGPGRIFGEPW